MTNSKKIVIFLAGIVAAAFFTLAGLTAFAAEAESKKNVFEISSGEIFLNFALDGKHYTATETGNSDSGILIKQKNGSVSFKYSNAVDFSDKTEKDPFIEFYSLIGRDKSTLDNVTVTLTDAEDPENYFSVYAYTDYANGVIYGRVRYNGLDRARSGDSYHDAAYGAYPRNAGFYYAIKRSAASDWQEWSETNKVHPLSISFDYRSKEVYLISQNGGVPIRYPVLDLDAAADVGSGQEWAGFKNGKAVISVTANFLNKNSDGGVIIKSIAGSNVGGEDFSDASSYPVPEITFDNESAGYIDNSSGVKRLPDGSVGNDYKIPDAKAFDWYFGNCENMTAEIFSEDGGEFSFDGKSGVFTPQQAGDYRVEYTASNGKQSSSETLYFKVTQNQAPMYIALKGDFTTGKLFTTVEVPETVVYGGSGSVEKVEKLFYNGRETELSDERTVYLSETGSLVLSVTANVYSGKTAKKDFVLTVADCTVLNVSGVPRAVSDKAELILPEAQAYNSRTGEKAFTEITVDGKAYHEGFIADLNDVKYDVEYSASTEYGTESKKFTVYVLPSTGVTPADFFVSESDVCFTDGRDGLIINTSENNACAEFVFSLVTGYSSDNMYITMKGVEGKTNFGYIDIVLEDVDGIYPDSYIRIYKNSDRTGQSVLYVGGSDNKYYTNGSFSDVNTSVGVYINGGAVYNASLYKKICDLPDYKAQRSYVTLRFGDVTGESEIIISNISNIGLNIVKGSPWQDRIAPVLLFEREFENDMRVVPGAEIIIPETTAFDVVSPTASAKLVVFAPSGDKILETQNLSAKNKFTCLETGIYQIIFEVSDGGKGVGTITYTCTVYDNVTPILTIEGNIAKTVKKGRTLVLPDAAATDDRDGELKVYVMVRHSADYLAQDCLPGQTIAFDRYGTYTVTYFAHDSSFNYVKYTFTVEVGD